MKKKVKIRHENSCFSSLNYLVFYWRLSGRVFNKIHFIQDLTGRVFNKSGRVLNKRGRVFN